MLAGTEVGGFEKNSKFKKAKFKRQNSKMQNQNAKFKRCQKSQNARKLLAGKFFSRIENLLQGFCHTGLGFYIFYGMFGRFSIILYIVATPSGTQNQTPRQST
jgi:hypothetical protein